MMTEHFFVEVDLKNGKNSITIEAENKIGKKTRSVITIHKEKGDSIIEENSKIAKYLPLIITLSASIILIIVMILLTKKRKQKNEEDK